MSPDVTLTEAIAWLRRKANLFNEAANILSEDLIPPGSDPSPIIVPELTLETLRKRLAYRHARIGDLARHFHVTEATIQALVDDAQSGIYQANRGWLKLTGEVAKVAEPPSTEQPSEGDHAQ